MQTTTQTTAQTTAQSSTQTQSQTPVDDTGGEKTIKTEAMDMKVESQDVKTEPKKEADEPKVDDKTKPATAGREVMGRAIIRRTPRPATATTMQWHQRFGPKP